VYIHLSYDMEMNVKRHTPATSTLEKKPRYPLNRMFSVSQSRFKCYEEGNKSLSLPGIEPGYLVQSSKTMVRPM
jgi:transcriptional regulatory protein LevR